MNTWKICDCSGWDDVKFDEFCIRPIFFENNVVLCGNFRMVVV